MIELDPWVVDKDDYVVTRFNLFDRGDRHYLRRLVRILGKMYKSRYDDIYYGDFELDYLAYLQAISLMLFIYRASVLKALSLLRMYISTNPSYDRIFEMTLKEINRAYNIVDFIATSEKYKKDPIYGAMMNVARAVKLYLEVLINELEEWHDVTIYSKWTTKGERRLLNKMFLSNLEIVDVKYRIEIATNFGTRIIDYATPKKLLMDLKKTIEEFKRIGKKYDNIDERFFKKYFS